MVTTHRFKNIFVEQDGSGTRFETGFRFIGIGATALRGGLTAAFSYLAIREVRSAAFTNAFAQLSTAEAVHWPYLCPAIRRLERPWNLEECLSVLAAWLSGTEPLGLRPARLPERQIYVHVVPEGASYPPAPPMANGGPNDDRPDVYRFRKGFLLRGLSDGVEIAPVWAR